MHSKFYFEIMQETSFNTPYPKGSDEYFMQRCLDLAQLGQGQTSPNPMVGSVIVYKGEIIGEGFHHRCGEAHAEVNAIHSVKNQELLKEAVLYVNLEPCAHQGRTPACSKLIIKKQIPRVVIACTDPFEKVSGKGIAMLEASGVEVKVGVLEQQALHLNRRFFTFHTQKRPYIMLKWAETKDGFIDLERTQDEQKGAWITNELARAWVHKWRTEEPAIWVGTQTVVKDNPQLTVRSWTGKSPLRIGIDRFNIFSKQQAILDDSVPTVIFTYQQPQLNKTFKNTQWIKIDKQQKLIPSILDYLYQNDILSVMVEGGKEVLEQFIDADLWDEARVFIGNTTFQKGTKAPYFFNNPEKSICESIHIGDCQLHYYSNNPYIFSFQNK